MVQFLGIARAAWPVSPCAGREIVHTGAAADAYLAGIATGEGNRIVGHALPATCEIWLHSGLPDLEFCDVLVHEDGHDAGYGHSDDPLAAHAPAGPQAVVMTTSAGEWPACVAATMRSEVDSYVRDLLPSDGAGWRVVCTSLRERHPRCRASRPGSKARRFTVLTDGGQIAAVMPSVTR